VGYWRRPDLDLLHFPPDPRHPGRRCNVSGDRGYIDDAGLLHFLGREGTRVKIRGHTVDLAEIEAAMAATPGIVRSAAFAPAPGEGKEATRIVAFVTVDAPVEAGELRRRLADRLPSYMLPSAFVFLDGFPTTSTGKVDRLALEQRIPAEAAGRPPAA
jgi:acyl-coenzyme A synthetase/AMP-(fatty) acid ligase